MILSLLGGAALAEPVCEVAALVGEVQVQDAAGTRSLRAGERLEPGAELRSGAQARVRLRFIDGSTLVLADRSQLRIERFVQGPGQPREAALLLQLGLIGQQVKPAAGGSWRVRTPTAVTAVRGTEFSVEVASDLATAVHVSSGAVAVEPLPAETEAGADGAASAPFSSKAPALGQTRGLRKPRPVLLQAARNGTRCDAQGLCSEAAAWSAERVQQLQQRLGGF
ncbi:FecR family protein [Paucibacter soli]|uniref:FecR family protein n=1 Tax=Paucibacter soli TaxID=3133433 RepID=UPI0030B46805